MRRGARRLGGGRRARGHQLRLRQRRTHAATACSRYRPAGGLVVSCLFSLGLPTRPRRALPVHPARTVLIATEECKRPTVGQSTLYCPGMAELDPTWNASLAFREAMDPVVTAPRATPAEHSDLSVESGHKSPGEGAVVSALPAELMLDPVRQIDGFVHACLVDATSGMILSSLEEQDGLRLPVATPWRDPITRARRRRSRRGTRAQNSPLRRHTGTLPNALDETGPDLLPQATNAL